MKKCLIAFILSIYVTASLTGCGKKAEAEPMSLPMQQNNSQKKTAVETTKISKSSISDEYMYSGTITPKTEVNVLSTISGKVAQVNFDVGDKVNKGDVLFVMDTSDIMNSINIAQASLKSAEAGVKTAQTNLELANGSSMQTQIENAKNSVTNAETSIKDAEISIKNAETSVETSKTSLNNAQISLDKAKNDYEINKRLYDAGGISKETVDNYKNSYEQAQNSYTQAQNSYTQAQLSLEQAQNSLEKAQTTYEQAQSSYNIVANQTPEENIKKAQDNLAQAQASRESAQAQLQSSQKSLSDATVKSPISGTVLECNITAGAVLSQGSSPFVIIDLDTVNVEVNVSENMINHIQVNDSVKIKVSSLSNETFNGNVSSISPGSNSDGTYTVKIEIPNSDGRLKSGMFAEVYFAKEQSESAIVLPRSAVISKNDENYVFIVEDETAKKVNVELGIDNGDEIEIKSGVNEDMRVVTKGQTYLKDGEAVNDVSKSSIAADNENLDNING